MQVINSLQPSQRGYNSMRLSSVSRSKFFQQRMACLKTIHQRQHPWRCRRPLSFNSYSLKPSGNILTRQTIFRKDLSTMLSALPSIEVSTAMWSSAESDYQCHDGGNGGPLSFLPAISENLMMERRRRRREPAASLPPNARPMSRIFTPHTSRKVSRGVALLPTLRGSRSQALQPKTICVPSVIRI